VKPNSSVAGDADHGRGPVTLADGDDLNLQGDPPNWASTLHNDSTSRRNTEVAGLLTMSHAGTAPSTPAPFPRTAR
jgi:hypothetical protein